MCVLLIALETRTARRFCDLCGILCRSCLEKYEKWEKCPLVLYVKPWNKGFIISLLFHSFDFRFRNISYGLICASYRSHKEYTNDETTRTKPFECFMWLTKNSVARKSSFLYKSSLTNARKKKSKCVALYFCPVLQYNTIYYRGIFFAGPLEFIWLIDAVME